MNSWTEEIAPGSNALLRPHRSTSGELRPHDRILPIGAMERARHYLAGTAHTPGRPLAWRALFPFSRAEHSPLRGHTGVRRRPRLRRQHLVAATGRRRRAGHPHRYARGLFLVLLLPRARLVPCGNSFAKSGIRLRALPRQPHLVRGTRLRRAAVSHALRTVGSLSVDHRRPLLLPRLSF